VSSRFIKKGFQLKRPKPKSKDQLLELQKEQRRLEQQAKLEERLLKATVIIKRDIHSKDTAFSL